MTAALTMLLLATAPITVDARGTLGEALNQIATKGGINLIATGDLHQSTEVHLKGVTAEEAIDALVKVHHLELHKEGKLWVVKPASGSSASADAPTPPLPPPAPPAPLPPLPPGVNGKDVSPEGLEAEAEAAAARAAAAEARADALRDRAEAIREAKDDAAEAKDEEQQARLDEVKAAVEEAKAKAHQPKHGGGRKTVSTGPVVVAGGERVEDVVSYGGSVTLGDGVIADGDVVAFGGDVVMGDGVIVEGDAVSFGGTVKKGVGAVVKGEEVAFGAAGFGVKPMVQALPAVKAVEKTEEHSPVAGFLIKFAAFFGLGFLLMMFAPNRMRNIEAEIKSEPVKSGLAGLLAFLGAFPLTVLLGLTVIGIPVAVLMWLLGLLALLMGLLAFANTIGARFPMARLRRTQAAVLAVGLLLVMLVGLIPVVGPIAIIGALCVSFGAIIRTRVGQRSLGLPVPESSIREVGV